MNTERIVRLVAGSLISLSLVMSHFHSPNWLFLTFFVGLNLFQSSISRWCLLEDVLVKVGFKSCCRGE